MTTVTSSLYGSETYTYDGDGHRMRKQVAGRPRATPRRILERFQISGRVTRPADGALFLKSRLTRHRAFRDGYQLRHPDSCAFSISARSQCQEVYRVLS